MKAPTVQSEYFMHCVLSGVHSTGNFMLVEEKKLQCVFMVIKDYVSQCNRCGSLMSFWRNNRL